MSSSQSCPEAIGLPPEDAQSGAGSTPRGWPRKVYQRPWFAWRPVRLNGEGGGWVWFRTVTKTRLLYRAGDRLIEGNVYALLP
jgi:hypothetical protein